MDLTRLASIQRTNALNGMVKFVEMTKPYHSQILDIGMEYKYKEYMTVQLSDSYALDVEITQNNAPLEHLCSDGYGILWEGSDSTELYPTSYIISASAPEHITATPGMLLGSPSMSQYLRIVTNPTPNYLPVDSYITFQTTGELPITTPQILIGMEYKIVESSINNTVDDYIVISIDDTIIEWTDVAYSGTLAIVPVDENINSFIIESSLGTLFDFSVTNLPSNILTFAVTYPGWPQGTKVSVITTDTLPTPLSTLTPYYVQPIPGTDNVALSTVRYPTLPSHYVDITDVGVGVHGIQKLETFFVGQPISVVGSYNNLNDDNYNVYNTIRLSPTTEQIFVLGRIVNTTPLSLIGGSPGNDGTITARIMGYSETSYCPPISMNNMHVEANMSEKMMIETDGSPSIYQIV